MVDHLLSMRREATVEGIAGGVPAMTTPCLAEIRAPAEGMIEVRDVVACYGRTSRAALDGVSLTVQEGEVTAVLGANGSGKSTLLRCTAGMLQPASGSVRVGGRELGGLSGRALAELRMTIGMVFQQANLVKRRNVLANVLTGTLGRHRNWPSMLGVLPHSEVGCASACLAEVGLLELATQRAGTLSGGQAQRVSIARALAQAPRVLLADEPVASLDPEAAEEVMRLLRRVSHDNGLAVLCVLHQPELARRYADRIVGLRAGRVAFLEPAAVVGPRDVAALYEGAAA
jgi:phosphonate transport system ATP-binding protein